MYTLGQIYHLIGSLLPTEKNEPKFLQIYFMGDEQEQIKQRCKIVNGLRQDVIQNIQRCLHQNNNLINGFKYALEQMPTNDFKLVIKADYEPKIGHKKRFNAPEINEVAIIMVDDESDFRDIIIKKKK